MLVRVENRRKMPSKDGTASILKGLEPSKVRGVIEDFALLSDPISRQLLGKLASPHSPILATEYPIKGHSRNLVLMTLHRLEAVGVVKSEMIEQQNSLVRQFEITELGRKVAGKIANIPK